MHLAKANKNVIFESYAVYPCTGQVRLTNHTVEKGPFTLALRIPAWSKNTSIRINGKSVENVQAGTYCELGRVWTVGDVVDITFDMAVQVHELDHYIAFSRGPIALARDTRFNDGPIDEVFRREYPTKGLEGRFLPVRSPSEDVWMAFSAPLPVGSHHENPEGSNWPQIHFCDYASAANLWEPGNACRVWFPVEWLPNER